MQIKLMNAPRFQRNLCYKDQIRFESLRDLGVVISPSDFPHLPQERSQLRAEVDEKSATQPNLARGPSSSTAID